VGSERGGRRWGWDRLYPTAAPAAVVVYVVEGKQQPCGITFGYGIAERRSALTLLYCTIYVKFSCGRLSRVPQAKTAPRGNDSIGSGHF